MRSGSTESQSHHMLLLNRKFLEREEELDAKRASLQQLEACHADITTRTQATETEARERTEKLRLLQQTRETIAQQRQKTADTLRQLQQQSASLDALQETLERDAGDAAHPISAEWYARLTLPFGDYLQGRERVNLRVRSNESGDACAITVTDAEIAQAVYYSYAQKNIF